MPGARAWEEISVGVLAEPAVSPGGNSFEGPEKGCLGGWTCEVVESVGRAADGAEGGVEGWSDEAEKSNFVVGVTNQDGLRKGRTSAAIS